MDNFFFFFLWIFDGNVQPNYNGKHAFENCTLFYAYLILTGEQVFLGFYFGIEDIQLEIQSFALYVVHRYCPL